MVSIRWYCIIVVIKDDGFCVWIWGEKFGNHKILFNTGLTPACDLDVLRTWLSHGDNYYFCDSLMALGDESLKEVENVSCYGGYSGGSYQAIERLTEKSLANLDQFLAK